MEESIQGNALDLLDTILEETILNYVIELERILERPWTGDDFTRTVMRMTKVATDATSVEEALNLELAHLGATGAVAEQLADLLPDYFEMLMRSWLTTEGLSGDEDSGADDVLSQFKTRRYKGAVEGIDEDDGETDICSICLEHLRRGLVATLHCDHEFHGGCIGRWLHRGQNVCPLCKDDVLLL
ncbi:RING-type E3 ubiquitin transferase [Salvia divinorum]|uniref:RING-type E3 ubiquitin transferase n=1 Tax=Salvia divinorum TaxID=28513 RepID=A0ABD1IGI9_SALDI